MSNSPRDLRSDNDLFVQAVERSQEFIESGRCADAEEAMEEILELAVKLVEQDESPDWQLVVEAGDREAALDYAGMEAAHLKRLALQDGGSHNAGGAHRDLANLYVTLNRHDEAIHHARQATSTACKLDVPIATAMALRSEGTTYLQVGRVSDAERCFAEGLEQLDPQDATYRQMRASLLTLMATCALHTGQCASARKYLEAADLLSRPLQLMLFAAGVQSTMANWWAATAKLQVLLGENDEAIAAWEHAVSLARHVAELPQCQGLYTRLNVAAMLHDYARSMETIDQHDAAQTALGESRQIVGRLGLPPQRYYDSQ